MIHGVPKIRPSIAGSTRGFAQGRTRTDDLRITNALLYQLSYLGKADHFNS